MKKIFYTKHAKEMLDFRRINLIKVEQSIKNPDETFDAREGKRVYLKNFGDNYLKLIIAEERDKIIVVTLCNGKSQLIHFWEV